MKDLISYIVLRLSLLFNGNRKLAKEEEEVWMLIRARTRICSMQIELATLSRNMAIWIANLDSTCPPEMVAEYQQRVAAAKRRTAELERELEHDLLGVLRAHGVKI
jgi:hypothetical protein